jgi:glycosyltransferase involved in cell wall biosynthesis
MLLLGMEQLAGRRYRVLLACPPGSPLAEGARARGFDVFECEFLYMRHSPRSIARYGRSIRSVGPRILELAERHSVSLLHAYSPVAALYAVRAAQKCKIPLVVHMHDAQRPKWLRRGVIRYLARRASAFFCVSRTVQAMLIDIGVSSRLTRVVPNAVDPRFLDGAPEAAAEVPRTGLNIGLFGQIVPWKGQHVFLEAAAEVVRRVPGVRFYVVGTLADPGQQPYLDRLTAVAGGAPLEASVTFAGFQAAVDRWLAAMDVVVHASIEPEAFGLVIAEAMALGKAVVATDVGGPAEIIDDGVTGRLVPPGDATALAAAVTELIQHPDPAMGRRAAAVVRERFSPDAHGAALTHAYEELPRRRERA